MLAFILLLSAEGVAKLASAFSLFRFINLSVIVMRESHISSYAPGYRSPLYPWMQIAGILTTLVLIPTMGVLSILFRSVWWPPPSRGTSSYVRGRVVRAGAIYHLFAGWARRATTRSPTSWRPSSSRKKSMRTLPSTSWSRRPTSSTSSRPFRWRRWPASIDRLYELYREPRAIAPGGEAGARVS